MKKTRDSHYNEDHVRKVYEEVTKKLNPHEQSMLVDRLVWDKRLLIKTVNLIMQDLQEA